MNWFKYIFSQKTETKKKPNYLQIGHNPFSSKKPDKESNLLWIYKDGQILVKPEVFESSTHTQNFPGFDRVSTNSFFGRYDPNSKYVSVVFPDKKIYNFREIPTDLRRKLHERFDILDISEHH